MKKILLWITLLAALSMSAAEDDGIFDSYEPVEQEYEIHDLLKDETFNHLMDSVLTEAEILYDMDKVVLGEGYVRTVRDDVYLSTYEIVRAVRLHSLYCRYYFDAFSKTRPANEN